jgi:hypothetical protein
MRGSKLVAVLALTALVLVGCGGGDDSGGTTGGGAGTTTGGDGGSFDGGALDAATCAQVVAAMAAAYSQSAAAMTGGDASDLQASIDQLEAFAGSAPDEIADDMQVIASAYATMSQAFADIGWDPTSGTAPTPEQAAALQEATAAINTTEFQQASDNVSAWFQDQCGT